MLSNKQKESLNKKNSGCLFVVATPIGNMDDITFRAVKVLASVNIIVAENIHLTSRLLYYYDIKKTRLLSMNEHNEAERIPLIIKKINSNFNVALVSSAGTPLISDPGFKLLCSAIDNSIKVIPIPGVSAIISAMSVSGLPTNAFIFLGFPARKRGKRLNHLQQIAFEKKTLIFYESPKRIINFLVEVLEIFGDRYIVVSREMTKIYEEFIRGKISYVLEKLKNKDQLKGECTLIISGYFNHNDSNINDCVIKSIKKCLNNSTIHTSSLSKYISKKYNLRKSDAYDIILSLKKN